MLDFTLMTVSPSEPRLTPADADHWFRMQGLPAFVPRRRWFHDIARRAAPLVVAVAVFWAFAGDGLELLQLAGELFGRSKDDTIIAITIVTLVVLTFILAWALYAATQFAVRRLPATLGSVFATVAIVAATVDAVVGGIGEPGDVGVAGRDGLLIVGACILFIALGGAALVAWAARLAVRNLFAMGHMAAIALPVILMLVLFSFFAAEIWQMGTLLTARSLLLLTLVVAVLSVLVVVRVAAAELSGGTETLSSTHRASLLRGTPVEGCRIDGTEPRALGLSQRLNMLLAIVLSQMVQAAFFALLLAALLVVIGAITVPSSLVQTWIGGGENPPKLLVEPVVLQGVQLPLTTNLLKSAALLAVISALPFVFSTVSERRYREAFFEPIVADMHRAILVRALLHEAGRSALPGPEGGPGGSTPPASC